MTRLKLYLQYVYKIISSTLGYLYLLQNKMFGHGCGQNPDNGPARGPTTDKVAWLVQKSGDNYESNQFLDK